jgi:uncharacterized membrane protein YdbT with pleckstrin-like domain
MAEVVIRPTLKFIKAGYVAVVLVIAVTGWFAVQAVVPEWLPAVAALLLVWPIERHLRRQMRKVVITDDQLRYEVGFVSKTTRTISLAKVQDVTVTQSFWQRLTATGNLSIETAGKDSWEAVGPIDRPQALADQLHQASEAATRQNLFPRTEKGKNA